MTEPDPDVPERARGPRRYSAPYKARILEEYERLDKEFEGLTEQETRLGAFWFSRG